MRLFNTKGILKGSTFRKGMNSLSVEEETIPEISSGEERLRRITLSWDKGDPEETASAEKVFTKYIRKGWLAFHVTSDNRKRQVFSFDPELGRVQLVPLVEGG